MSQDFFINLKQLHAFCLELLVANSFPRDKSQPLVEVLIEADARGIHSHGVARLKRYIQERDAGYIEPDAEYQIVTETPSSLVVDAQKGLGQYVAKNVMTSCIEKAKQSGICIASIRNSNHFGMAGIYAEAANSQGMIGLSMTNSYPLVVPTFGRQAMLGSNPISVAFPGINFNFLLDMATSVVSRGKLEVYRRKDKELPENWTVDASGLATTNVDQVLKNFDNRIDGGLLPLGGSEEQSGSHKGFGLAMLVDLLTAGLSLGSWSHETYSSEGGGVCHFLGAVNLSMFGDTDAIKRHAEHIITDIITSKVAEKREKIFYPGEKEQLSRAVSTEKGICLEVKTVEILTTIAKQCGIALPPQFNI